ncbi:MAG: fused MFS/spermidine synthase [Pirellulales bacterium]|nr:fused MFS/spermidine synthase [Pirellulales bacterium]
MPAKHTQPPAWTLVWWLAATIFVSALLLFQVQPLISKFILPWYGGSPAVWTTAMLFFQCVLFLGYLYAHLAARHLSPRQQLLTQGGLLLLAAVLAWWVVPPDSLKPTGEENPTLSILGLLSLSVGLPYFLLSTTGPLVQTWFSRAYPGQSPYRLFALSNFGSLLALLSFPFLFEPYWELPTLGRFWMVGFWVFVGLWLWTAWQVAKLRTAGEAHHFAGPESEKGTDTRDETRTPGWRPAAWLALPAVASLVFIATANEVSHNVAPTPFLWIVPLALYLLTFIIAFDHPAWYVRGWWAPLCAAAIMTLAIYQKLADWLWQAVVYESVSSAAQGWFKQRPDGWHLDMELTYVPQVGLIFATMFLMCLVCHGELVRLRPANPRDLTKFYLLISAGGACGGLFISFVATNFFDDYYEWPIGLAICLGIAILVCWREYANWRPANNSNRWQGALGFGLAACVGWGLLAYGVDPWNWFGGGSTNNAHTTTQTLFKARNFYGTVGVYEDLFLGELSPEQNGGIARSPRDNNRRFKSGAILHGQQFMSPDRRNEPLTYYDPQSGVGQALTHLLRSNPRRPIKFAVIGLGVGSLAAYARGGETLPDGESRGADECVMYEINPLVERIAREHFWYLGDYAQRTGRPLEVRLGDARLTMEREAPQGYDLIVLDAFSGDSIPAHLLTREAFEIYRRHLRKDANGRPAGCLAVHITNSYLNLYPVAKNAARGVLDMDYRSVYRESRRRDYVQRSHYFIISNDAALLAAVPTVPRRRAQVDPRTGQLVEVVVDYDWPEIPIWTDHYSNLFKILLAD